MRSGNDSLSLSHTSAHTQGTSSLFSQTRTFTLTHNMIDTMLCLDWRNIANTQITVNLFPPHQVNMHDQREQMILQYRIHILPLLRKFVLRSPKSICSQVQGGTDERERTQEVTCRVSGPSFQHFLPFMLFTRYSDQKRCGRRQRGVAPRVVPMRDEMGFSSPSATHKLIGLK